MPHQNRRQQLNASGIGDLRTSLRTAVAMDLAATELPFERRAAMPIGDRGADNTAIPMPIGLSGNLQPGLAARIVIEPPQGGDAAHAAGGAIARVVATDGAAHAANDDGDVAHAANDDGDEVLAGGGGTAARGSARAPAAHHHRIAMSAEERKRRNTAATQERRVRQRQLVAAAAATAAENGQLTNEQQRALEVRDRNRVREKARGHRERDWSRAKRPNRRRRTTPTAEADDDEGEELAVAAAAIVLLAG